MGLFDSIETYSPYSQQTKAIENLIWKIIKSENFKSDLSTYIRMEIEASKAKYSAANNSNTLSYDFTPPNRKDIHYSERCQTLFWQSLLQKIGKERRYFFYRL